MFRGGGIHHDVDHLRVSQIGKDLLEGQTEHIDVANPSVEQFPAPRPRSAGLSYATSAMSVIIIDDFRKAQFV